MTDTLLIIIAVLLAVRIVLQVRQGKRAFDKSYATTCDVENISTVVDRYRVHDTIRDYGKRGYELVQVIDNKGGSGNSEYQLFFTRKKIKNFLEE
ncbi:MAG: hypothetical protein K2N48_01095 [Muribaculaceae bacterium]|nr:hypothetical protein [Muribaculaceae bacterium]